MSPPVKDAHTPRSKTSPVNHIFNCSTSQSVEIYPKHLKGSDFKWVVPEGIKPSTAVFVLPEEQQQQEKISPTSIFLHYHKRAAAVPLPPTHTPVKLHLSAKHEPFAEK